MKCATTMTVHQPPITDVTVQFLQEDYSGIEGEAISVGVVLSGSSGRIINVGVVSKAGTATG